MKVARPAVSRHSNTEAPLAVLAFAASFFLALGARLLWAGQAPALLLAAWMFPLVVSVAWHTPWRKLGPDALGDSRYISGRNEPSRTDTLDPFVLWILAPFALVVAQMAENGVLALLLFGAGLATWGGWSFPRYAARSELYLSENGFTLAVGGQVRWSAGWDEVRSIHWRGSELMSNLRVVFEAGPEDNAAVVLHRDLGRDEFEALVVTLRAMAKANPEIRLENRMWAPIRIGVTRTA